MKVPQIVASFLFAATLSMTGCKQRQHVEAASEAAPTRVEAITVSTGSPVDITSAGSIVSDHRVDITSRLSGYIRGLPVHEGEHVRRGQVLVRIDPVDVDGGIRQAQAGVNAAEAAFRDADADRVRFQNLYKRGDVSENELRKITLKYDAARETLNQAHAINDTARGQREYTELRSPINGTVIARTKLVGDLALPGLPILTVESGSDLMFECYMDTSEHLAPAYATGAPVDVQVDGINTPLKGTIRRVVPSADPASRSYQIKIALPEVRGLMPGMYGRAVFHKGESNLPAVPRLALTDRGGLTGVFVIDNRNKAHFRWIRTGREWSNQIEITAGLQPGERLVNNPVSTLHDGDPVSVTGEAR